MSYLVTGVHWYTCGELINNIFLTVYQGNYMYKTIPQNLKELNIETDPSIVLT